MKEVSEVRGTRNELLINNELLFRLDQKFHQIGRLGRLFSFGAKAKNSHSMI